MHPPDCPGFDYSKHPDSNRVLLAAVVRILNLLRTKPPPPPLFGDTRPVHHDLFAKLCQIKFWYFAGHYRGEEFRCLKYYAVEVKSDPRVGCPPEMVGGRMAELARSIEANVAAMDGAHELPVATLATAEKLVFAVAYACRLFVEFLEIHPYADGNGHVARWLLTAVLHRYGYRLNEFPIEPRPHDPPYSELIARHRNGEVEALEMHVLRRVSPGVPPQ